MHGFYLKVSFNYDFITLKVLSLNLSEVLIFIVNYILCINYLKCTAILNVPALSLHFFTGNNSILPSMLAYQTHGRKPR